MGVVKTFQPTSGKFIKYNIDNANSSIGFQIMKFKIGAKVQGKFKIFNASFDYNKEAGAISNLNVVIYSNSIDTANEKRDNHLRTDDFFSSAKFKTINFTSGGPFKITDNSARVIGDLKIKETTKPIIFDIKFNDNSDMISLDAVGLMKDRKEWGITWNAALDKGGFVLGDEVEIEIKGNAKKI